MNSELLAKLRAGYQLLVNVATNLQSPLLLVLRLYWGWSFFQAGKGKLLNHTQTAEFFAGLNIPLPGLNAWVAAATECFGGLFLLVGLATRLTCVPLIITMIVAYLTADFAVVRNIFSDPDSFTSASPFLFLLVSVLVFAFGPGAFSLDRWLAKKFAPSEPARPRV